jgi:hypothetical protein
MNAYVNQQPQWWIERHKMEHEFLHIMMTKKKMLHEMKTKREKEFRDHLGSQEPN